MYIELEEIKESRQGEQVRKVKQERRKTKRLNHCALKRKTEWRKKYGRKYELPPSSLSSLELV
jgi:hypothetical protein